MILRIHSLKIPVSSPALSFLSVAVGDLPRPDRAPAGTRVIPLHSANLPTGRPTRTPPHRSTRSRHGTFSSSPRAWARGGSPPPPASCRGRRIQDRRFFHLLVFDDTQGDVKSSLRFRRTPDARLLSSS